MAEKSSSLVDQQHQTHEVDGSSQQQVCQGKVVADVGNSLHRLVGIATMKEDRVIEDTLPQHKVKYVLVPRGHGVNAIGTLVVVGHISTVGVGVGRGMVTRTR